MAAGWPFAVALMQPAPPARRVASRKLSEPANTSKPRGWKHSGMARVLAQSPEPP